MLHNAVTNQYQDMAAQKGCAEAQVKELAPLYQRSYEKVVAKTRAAKELYHTVRSSRCDRINGETIFLSTCFVIILPPHKAIFQ